MGGKPKTTDLLLNLVAYASDRNEDGIDETVAIVIEKHRNCISSLSVPDEEKSALEAIIIRDIQDIRDVLKTVSLMKWKPSKIQSLVSGYGEVWSANILAAVMRGIYPNDGVVYRYLDARLVLVVDESVDDEQVSVGQGARRRAGAFVQITHSSKPQLQASPLTLTFSAIRFAHRRPLSGRTAQSSWKNTPPPPAIASCA